jgi:hypothetical protein
MIIGGLPSRTLHRIHEDVAAAICRQLQPGPAGKAGGPPRLQGRVQLQDAAQRGLPLQVHHRLALLSSGHAAQGHGFHLPRSPAACAQAAAQAAAAARASQPATAAAKTYVTAAAAAQSQVRARAACACSLPRPAPAHWALGPAESEAGGRLPTHLPLQRTRCAARTASSCIAARRASWLPPGATSPSPHSCRPPPKLSPPPKLRPPPQPRPPPRAPRPSPTTPGLKPPQPPGRPPPQAEQVVLSPAPPKPTPPSAPAPRCAPQAGQ